MNPLRATRRLAAAIALALMLIAPAARATTGLLVPGDGYWNLTLCDGSLCNSTGSFYYSADLGASAILEWPNTASLNFTDAVAYQICNRTGAAVEWTVGVYYEAWFESMSAIQTDTVKIPDDSCAVVKINLGTTWTVDSIRVAQSSVF